MVVHIHLPALRIIGLHCQLSNVWKQLCLLYPAIDLFIAGSQASLLGPSGRSSTNWATDIHSFTILKARVQNQEMREVGSFPGILRHNSSPLGSDYSSFLTFQPPNSMLCLLWSHGHLPSVSVPVPFFLLIKGHQSDWIKGPPSSRMTSSMLITSATTLLLNMVTF